MPGMPSRLARYCPPAGGNPKRDMVDTEGQKLRLGDTTLMIYLTPGHTDGTLSFTFPVKDHGRTRVIAYPGGTAYNFPRSVARFQAYIDTQKRFAKIAADAGATVIPSNHSEFDEAYMKARMISTMMPGEDNPFVIKDGVQRYQTVLVECAEAEKVKHLTAIVDPLLTTTKSLSIVRRHGPDR